MPQPTPAPAPTERRKRAHQRLDELMDRAEREGLSGEVYVKPKYRNGKIFHVEFSDTMGDHFGD